MEVDKHLNFLSLLFNTDKQQALALLYTITNKQVSAISEIVSKILRIEHNKAKVKQIKIYQLLMKKLADKKFSVNKKNKIIETHRRKLLKLLSIFKIQLNNLLK